MTPFGREQMVFLSHSSLDKPEIEEIILLLNGMDLPVWFDKYSIALGDSITDKVQEGIQQSSIVLFWITEHFLIPAGVNLRCGPSSKLIEEDVRVISVLDRGIQISACRSFSRTSSVSCGKNGPFIRSPSRSPPLSGPAE